MHNRPAESLFDLFSDLLSRFRSQRVVRRKRVRQYQSESRHVEFLESRTLLSAVNISVDANVADEQSGNTVTVTATAEAPVAGNQTVTVAASGAGITAGDLMFLNTTITILDGETSGTATFSANDDGILEVNETATLTLTGFSGGVSAGSTISVDVTIADNKQEAVVLDAIDRFPGRQPTLTWQEVAGAARYEIWFSRVSPSPGRIVSDTQVTTNSYSIPQLDEGLYRYWVRAFDSNGEAGSWSSSNQFEVQPTLVGPSTPVFSERPTFSWHAVPLVTSYEIFIRTLDGDVVVSDITDTEYTPSEDLPLGKIRWWIRDSDSPGNFGWSDVGIASIVDRTTLLSPGDTVSTRRPMLSWEAIGDASSYVVHVQNTQTSEVVFRRKNIGTTSQMVDSDLANGDYTFWVKAIDSATNQFADSAWSFPLTFTVEYIAPPIETLTVQLTEAIEVVSNDTLSAMLLTAINEHTDASFSQSMISSSIARDDSMTALATVSGSVSNSELASVVAFFPDNVHPGELGFLWDDVLAEVDSGTANQILADTIAQLENNALANAFSDVITTALDDQAIENLLRDDGVELTNETAMTQISNVIDALAVESSQVADVLRNASIGYPSIDHDGRVAMINRLFGEIDDTTLISLFTAVAEQFGYQP